MRKQVVKSNTISYHKRTMRSRVLPEPVPVLVPVPVPVPVLGLTWAIHLGLVLAQVQRMVPEQMQGQERVQGQVQRMVPEQVQGQVERMAQERVQGQVQRMAQEQE
jgi:hypothetical protein